MPGPPNTRFLVYGVVHDITITQFNRQIVGCPTESMARGTIQWMQQRLLQRVPGKPTAIHAQGKF